MRVLGFDIFHSRKLNRMLDELKKQREGLHHLHSKTQELHDFTTTVSTHHLNHKQEMSLYINRINDWIQHLHSSQLKLESKIESIENNLKILIKNDMVKYHEELVRHVRDNIRFNQSFMRQIKEEILDEISVPQQIEELPVYEEVPITPKINLSPPEQQLIRVLFNENTPMTYEDLAQKTGKSINSIRVYMNSAKSKKDIIEEFRKPTGEKIFGIKNKEKVKTLFNIA